MMPYLKKLLTMKKTGGFVLQKIKEKKLFQNIVIQINLELKLRRI